MWYRILVTVLSVSQVYSAATKRGYSEQRSCDIGPLALEIASYNTVVRDIIDYVRGPFRGIIYDELAKFVDKFGPRVSGSQLLEDSIDYMIRRTQQEGIDDIATENVTVPVWVRGKEKLTMLQPRVKNINLLGLGDSVSTPPGGITAEVVVVTTFDELDNLSYEQVFSKIVLFSPVFTTYRNTVKYREGAASHAARKGASAALIRTIAPFSINSPHTGSQNYEYNVTKIPVAAVTLEDADLIQRFYRRGDRVLLNLTMSSTFGPDALSRNTLIDLKGMENPEKLVIVSGHIDSWDVGQGALDDGGGMFISWAVPVILKRLNLKPKRTIRTILWTAEEVGLVGAKAYEEKHRNELHNINYIMESDEGTFTPLGLEVGGSHQAKCIVAEILKLMTSINATTLVENDSPGSDIAVIIEKGVPGASLYNANDRYFWFHHSEGDTMNVVNRTDLDLGAALFTAVAYVISNMSVDIPRVPTSLPPVFELKKGDKLKPSTSQSALQISTSDILQVFTVFITDEAVL